MHDDNGTSGSGSGGIKIKRYTDYNQPSNYLGSDGKPLRIIDYAHKLPVTEDCRPEACATCPFKGRKAGTRGPVDSPFVIVGESPGATELWKGYPFVGQSGEMLEATLEKCGFDLDDTKVQPYVINAIQCLPLKKDEGGLEIGVRACNNRLQDLIAAHPRKVILTLGNAALWGITHDYSLKITKEHGKLFKTPLAEHGAVATYHPAYILRNGTAYTPWKKDIQYAIDLLNGNDTKAGKWRTPMWGVIENREQLEDLVNRMEHATHIAADNETGGHDINGASYGFDWQRGYIVMLGITSNLSNGNYVDIIPTKVIWDNEDLMRRLLGNKAKWIWQNGKFDVKWFRYEGIKEARVDEDTMLLSYCLNENKGHDLDSIAWEHIGAAPHKDVITEWFESRRIKKANRDYGLLPKYEILYPYAANDISKTYHSYFVLREKVANDKHSEKQYTNLMIPGSEFLTQVEMKGLKLDLERISENDVSIVEQLKEPNDKIQEYAMQYLGHTINVGSYQQLQVLLYDKMKLGPRGSSTDDDSMIKILRKFPDARVAHWVQVWRTLSKARNTYVKNAYHWPGTDGRVHITFKMHATTTGRLASGDPTNLQNWPRDPRIRGAFIAEDGHIFCSVDLNQAELRCLALMSGDPTLMEIYLRNEVSIHHITSVAMFGEHYTDDEKMRAKAVNFGIVYGRTAPSLAQEFNISIREAEEYIRVWLARYPVAAKFIQSCREAPNNQRTLITTFGRKKRWGAISQDNRRNSENEAANFPHQSTAHDITLLSGIECQPVIRKLWGGEFVNEIHDDIMSEVLNDPNYYGPMIAYIRHVMQRVPQDWGLTKVPFIAEAKVGTRWGAKRNAKEMKPPETREEVLSQYMTDFTPSGEHVEMMHKLMRDNNVSY